MVARWLSPAAFVLCFLVQQAAAQHLPIQKYTPADGLPSSFVQHILRDSRGYLWISTRNGVARFDGYQFVTYGIEQGLSHPAVNFVLQTRNGGYWIGTNGGGLCRFFPNGDPEAQTRSLFRCFPVGKSIATNQVNLGLEDHSGRLWAGTDGGVFVLEPGSKTFRRYELPSQKELSEDFGLAIMAILEDSENTIWIRTGQAGLYRVLSNGKVLRDPGWSGDTCWSALRDHKGQIWMPTGDGLRLLETDRNNIERFIIKKKYTPIDGLGSSDVRNLLQTSDGGIWATTGNGLSYFDGKSFHTYTKNDGLALNFLAGLVEDKDGNLWIGTLGAGVMKYLRKGFVSYNESSEGDFGPVHSITSSNDGRMYVISGDWLIHRVDREKLTSIRLPVPHNLTHLWLSNVALRDSHGDWWAATNHGLLRFSNIHRFEDLQKSKPQIYTTKDGLAGDWILKIYEDSAANLWISTTTAIRNRLSKWDRQKNTFYQLGEKYGLIPDQTPICFLEDAHRNLWIGYSDSALVRCRTGACQQFSLADGRLRGMVTALHLDHLGRLWIATNYRGIARVDRSSEDKLTFVAYTKRDGLSTNDCRTITQDRTGKIYIGTVHGVDQLDPVTGYIHHYTMADGLNSDFISVAKTDEKGDLWFGTYAGLSRFRPQPDLPRKRLPVLLTNLSFAGSPYPISELGETSISGIQLPHNRNHTQISYGAINFSLGENLRFQYKLEGAVGDWSQPTADHSVHYASLKPGNYRFVVRAVDQSGVISPTPASVEFKILKPVWLRWWFLTLAAMAGSLLIHSIYRIRLKRLLEIERLRTRIASDLHDDIGSNLSRIAILSETVRRKTNGDPLVLSLLTNMAEASREAIDSMSDIVWAVNPKKDQLRDLENRMRHLTGEILSDRKASLDFSASKDQACQILNPDLKRNVFLIFKECLNNIVRHSDSSTVNIRLIVVDNSLLLEIQDDGKGFDTTAQFEGQGLKNMMKRAQELNGNLEILSQPGNGSVIRLRTPIHHPGFSKKN